MKWQQLCVSNAMLRVWCGTVPVFYDVVEENEIGETMKNEASRVSSDEEVYITVPN